jgi:hypothetical protein
MTSEQILSVAAKNGILATVVEAAYDVTGGRVDGVLAQILYQFESSNAKSKVVMIVGDLCKVYGDFTDAALAAKNMMHPTTMAAFPNFEVTRTI